MTSASRLPVLPPGLVAVIGDEGTGKTQLLRRLGGDLASSPQPVPGTDALWLDLRLPDQDEQTPEQFWAALRPRCPGWDPVLQEDLIEVWELGPHRAKQLFMLSTGSRRKVALVGLLAAGAMVTCLDQPYGGLDAASIQVLREFLTEAACDPVRTWVVADYEADPRLPWGQQIQLG